MHLDVSHCPFLVDLVVTSSNGDACLDFRTLAIFRIAFARHFEFMRTTSSVVLGGVITNALESGSSAPWEPLQPVLDSPRFVDDVNRR